MGRLRLLPRLRLSIVSRLSCENVQYLSVVYLLANHLLTPCAQIGCNRQNLNLYDGTTTGTHRQHRETGALPPKSIRKSASCVANEATDSSGQLCGGGFG